MDEHENSNLRVASSIPILDTGHLSTLGQNGYLTTVYICHRKLGVVFMFPNIFRDLFWPINFWPISGLELSNTLVWITLLDPESTGLIGGSTLKGLPNGVGGFPLPAWSSPYSSYNKQTWLAYFGVIHIDQHFHKQTTIITGKIIFATWHYDNYLHAHCNHDYITCTVW